MLDNRNATAAGEARDRVRGGQARDTTEPDARGYMAKARLALVLLQQGFSILTLETGKATADVVQRLSRFARRQEDEIVDVASEAHTFL
jgi:hypothetical protein